MPARRPTRYYEKLGQDFFAAKKVSPGRGNELPHIHDQYELDRKSTRLNSSHWS